MSRISTGTGDRGTTGLADGSRVPKTDPRIEVVGAVDEVNDLLGLALSHLGPAGTDLAPRLRELQADLFALGAAVAGARGLSLPAEAIARVEKWTDELEAALPPLTKFILPGGVPAAAVLQTARSVARRAERAAWRAREAGHAVPEDALVYLNRLSDLLFLLARDVNRRAGVKEPEWAGRG